MQFKMRNTRSASKDGLTVKEFQAGKVYENHELNSEVYAVWKRDGILTEVKESPVQPVEPKPEKAAFDKVEDKQKAQKKRGVK